MPVASQSTREFKGDHISAHMFEARGNARVVYDGAMTNGSAVLQSATAAFTSDDVGKIATVQGAGAAGASLVSTIASVTDTTHATLADTASTTTSVALCAFGYDDTNAIRSTLVQLGGQGAGICRLIPTGVYLVTPGALQINNPQSGLLAGQGSRFNTVLRSNDPTSTLPILKLGDGTFEPHSYVVRNLSIDAGLGGSMGALYLNRTNLMAFRDVIVQAIGENGVGIDTEPSPVLFGEMIFDHVGVLGGEFNGGGVPGGSIGMRLRATSNIVLQSCNIENVETGLVFEGASQCLLTIVGGHFERIAKYALILSCCHPYVIQEFATGSVYLGNDVIGGNLMLTYSAGSWPNGVVIDNGFGNRIKKTSSQPHIPFIPGGDNARATFATGVDFRGDEWLKVENLNDDPTFLNRTDDWTAGGGAELAPVPIAMPGTAERGAGSIAIYSDAGGGYAERTFDCATDTDYLIQVGLLCRKTDMYRITVTGDVAGSIWDSGNLTQTFAVSEFQAFKVYRKRIPSISDTHLTVRVYSVNAEQTTILSLLLLSKSKVRMGTDYATGDVIGGFSEDGTAGSPDYGWLLDTSTGQTVYSVVGAGGGVDHNLRGRAFARAVVTVPDGVTAWLGVEGSGNAAEGAHISEGGPQIELREGTHEYVIPLMKHPSFNTLLFYSFIFGGNIEIRELGVFAIDEIGPTALIGQGWLRNDPGNSGKSFTVSQDHLYLGDNYNANFQTKGEAANNYKRVIYASNIQWDSDAGNWAVSQNGGGDWAAMVMLNQGDIAFACESGLTLPVTRTDAQFEAAIKYKIRPDGTIIYKNGSDTYTHYYGSGGPAFAALVGSTYIDVAATDGVVLYLKTSDSGGTSGWTSVATFWIKTTNGYRSNSNIGIGVDADATYTFRNAGGTRLDGDVFFSTLTASRPLKLNSSGIATAGKIDLGAANDVQASGLSADQTVQWDGSKAVGVSGIDGTIGGITAGPFGDTFVKDVVLVGAPPGTSLSVTYADAVTGLTVATRTFTKGVMTS